MKELAELRYNPLLGDWTMVASNRQKRPNMPKDYCPFCPGSGKVPDTYDVLIYDNDFPALSPNPPQPDDVATPLYRVAEAYGKCEVVLYSPEHTTTLPQLPVAHIRKLVDLWADRYSALGSDPRHQYVLIFENRGPEVGVTMPHPHGQIYAYPYVPQKIRVELESCRNHHGATGHCLICDITNEELRIERRIVAENDSFVAYIPFFTDYPYGVFIASRRHKSAITDFDDTERDDLADILKSVTAGMDALFDREFPYMMVLHQRPVHALETGVYYHFHIEFYPPLRDRDKIKYLASSETGAWAPCNPTAVEETAPRLRAAIAQARKGRRG
ncbi:galactose-1-phosphate uridylyltransferase [Alicyclobacillus herbarius]|uniref:galactose-1-phosphate uridylyltransferase n=1 Tax=Alicyclobacillus herbarius TaxID=122960 RepID=UPI001FE0A6A5|nr:galactose-1-phosphate uridylyltransferase [Alicyclobacillus herbarius]